jgi:hypothetical protein
MALLRALLLTLLLTGTLLARADTHADDTWVRTDATGQAEIQLYFFWSLSCPHCTAAHPFISAIPQHRPWVRLHALELSRNAQNVAHFRHIAALAGGEAAAVPSIAFCGELHVGWDDASGAGAHLLAELDACHARHQAGRAGSDLPAPAASSKAAAPPGADTTQRIDLPLFGSIDTRTLSLPALTVVLASLDAFNPCAFFVLLFLLSMMAHQKSRARMLLIGGIFVSVSGLMYFAFMAAWLNVFQIFGHLAWVTLAAGALAVFVGVVNMKDFFWFERGLSLSIPESRKPAIFRRARNILTAERLPAMLAATAFLAIAANFYELLCTAGFPMVFTRMLTLADLPGATRYAYLAAYNLIYVLPLAAIVIVFARTLGTRKLTEREGRLLKLMSGLMMLGLGALLLLAPERISHVGTAFGLMAAAVGLTWVAARTSPPGEGD